MAVPLCIACKDVEAWLDTARGVHSKYCSGDCQQLHSQYNKAMALVKKCAMESPNIVDPNDLPPPRCTHCNLGGSKIFDFATMKYIDFCYLCIPSSKQQSTANPRQKNQQTYQPPPQQVYHPSPQQQQQIYGQPQPTPSRGPELMRVVHRVQQNIASTKPPPNSSASRLYYNPPTVSGRNGLCAHCYQRPASGNTNLGLFCSNQCEQAEGRVQGCGILVVSVDYQIVVLVFMTTGPYKGLWSLFHGAKRAQELSRDCCVRIASENNAPLVSPTATDQYSMVEHSTPNVFSYTVFTVRDNLNQLPASQDINKGQFVHVRIAQFRQPLGNCNIFVMDVFYKQRNVSKHTHKVINQWLSASGV